MDSYDTNLTEGRREREGANEALATEPCAKVPFQPGLLAELRAWRVLHFVDCAGGAVSTRFRISSQFPWPVRSSDGRMPTLFTHQYKVSFSRR